MDCHGKITLVPGASRTVEFGEARTSDHRVESTPLSFVTTHVLDLDLSGGIVKTGWTGYNHYTVVTFQLSVRVKISVVRVNRSSLWASTFLVVCAPSRAL